jgi:hypothetical protein
VPAFTIEIARIVVLVETEPLSAAGPAEELYSGFLSASPPDASMCFRSGMPGLPPLADMKVLYSGPVWSMYEHEQRRLMVRHAGPPALRRPDTIGIWDDTFTSGDVFSRGLLPSQRGASLLPEPLPSPLSQVLMICLLAQRRGLLIHGCGIDDGGRGYLFAGNSGHGKTTMARLWQEQAVVLNDDRVVIRLIDGGLWLFGTPWHGDLRCVSAAGVPLEKIFFISHAEESQASRVVGSTAASMLLTRSFSPLWDKAGMAFTLDLLDHFELGFTPYGDIVDFVRCLS